MMKLDRWLRNAGMKTRVDAPAVWVLTCTLMLLSSTCHASLSDMYTLMQCTEDGPLGMISGEIRDWQISASSTFPAKWAKFCEEKYARLYQPNGYSWCAQYKGTSEWLQVDLGVVALITGVMSQGRGDGKEWVTSYLISISHDANKWVYIMDQYKNQKIFEGNSDSFSAKHNYLDEPVMARFIRIHPFKFHKHPSMRIELIGCQNCKKMLALPPYGKLAASSSRGKRLLKTCAPVYGHILSDKAWCAKKQDGHQWLQLDLGPPTRVTGLLTKGRGDGKRDNWVTAYRVAYSNDSVMWNFYKDAAHLSPKIFGGNHDRNTERIHYLNSAFTARFVRFHPIAWQGKIAMRVGVFGCPHRGECGSGFFRINNITQCMANLAYNKDAWVNGGAGNKLRKRHLGSREHWHQGAAPKAVDGKISRHSCTMLTNEESNTPAWFVDLKSRQEVSGVIIYTGLNDTNILLEHKKQLTNLDRLDVYVAKKPKHMERRKNDLLCNYITRLNNALFQPKIHIPCNKAQLGRYVYIEARGVSSTGWNTQFNAFLCEVLIY